MSSLRQGKTFAPFPLKSKKAKYYPAGSFSSHQCSNETEENFSSVSSHSESSYQDFSSSASIGLIQYEVHYSNPSQSTQTSDSNPVKKIEELQETIETLQQHCRSYEKQNESLQKELSAAAKDFALNNQSSLWTQVQFLKGKLNLHENMLGKVLEIAENLCEEEPDFSKTGVQDMHIYNYITSKLEILRFRMTRQTNRIQQLEFEKNSISEMLNYYIATDKIMETQKTKNSSSENTTPDLINSGFSRRNSILMETSTNVLMGRAFDDEVYYKRPLSSASDVLENQEPLIARNTFTNLKGISNFTINKPKSGQSFSVSPLVPKPKKAPIKPQPHKTNTFKAPKGDESKKKSKF